MAQPQLARITCPQCNACYNSESDLLTHMGVAHRMGRGKPSFQSLPSRMRRPKVTDARSRR